MTKVKTPAKKDPPLKKKKKPKNLSEVYADTVELIAAGLNQMGVKFDRHEPWDEIAKERFGKDLKRKQSIEENALLFKQYENQQDFHISVKGEAD